MNWTSTSGALSAGAAGAAVFGGVAYAATGKSDHQAAITAVSAIVGGLLAGLGGAALGKRSQFNRWNAVYQNCPAGQIPDWATLQCGPPCSGDNAPVNGQCPGVPGTPSLSKPAIFGTIGVAAAAGVAGLLVAA